MKTLLLPWKEQNNKMYFMIMKNDFDIRKYNKYILIVKFLELSNIVKCLKRFNFKIIFQQKKKPA